MPSFCRTFRISTSKSSCDSIHDEVDVAVGIEGGRSHNRNQYRDNHDHYDVYDAGNEAFRSLYDDDNDGDDYQCYSRYDHDLPV